MSDLLLKSLSFPGLDDRYISQLSAYGTCSTAASTAAKAVTISDFALQIGAYITIRFTYAVPANSTLNINSTSAKPIYYNNEAITAGIIDAGDTVTFIYDGTYLHVVHILLANRILFSQQNISIASNRWSSSGNSTYPYKAVVNVPGVTSSFYPIVQFSDTDSSTYDFSPSATSGDGTVTVMCKTSPSSAITIAQIVCYRGQLVTAS